MEAWAEHEGQDHTTWVCGCGATEDEACADSNLGPDEMPSYCGQMSEKVLSEETVQNLTAAGETFTTSCTPGEYTRCHLCGGSGRLVDVVTITITTCEFCAGAGVFDLAVPAEVARHAAAAARNVELNAAYHQRMSTNRAKRNRLP